MQLVVLAAGGSSRLGAQKQLLQVKGVPLVRQTVLEAIASALGTVVVVVGAEAPAIRSAIEDLPVHVVENPAWQSGIASSLRAGIDALPPDEDLMLVMLADQPAVTTSLLKRLHAEVLRTGAPIVACRYADTVGVPAVYRRSLFPHLRSLTGDNGAKQVILQHQHIACFVEAPEAGIDIDTLADWNGYRGS
ncbi:MAG: nucleotidyltransferase family protein [Bacteroidetes bacterium]|jgi:molybdenum cofactor cytidylyltransferase|nr:nucleotidyltransferase family protein [Bacteroidota bacterium]